MLSAHCSNVVSAPGVTGSDAPVPGWSKKISRPSDRHRLDPPLKGRQLRQVLAAREPVRDEHDVARTFARRAIGDEQVPVQRIARLREHCGSVSRGAGRVSVSCNELKQSVLLSACLENDGLMRQRHLVRRHARFQAQRRDQLS